MEVAAKLKNVRISPQKCRLIVDMVRGMPVAKAIEVLKFDRRKGSLLVRKTVESAIANAEFNHGADIDELSVSKIFVDEGPVSKRMMPRAKGRANSILKRTSHITVVVSDSDSVEQ